jgi:hypothetical protein
LKVHDDHLYHGAALIQIAEHAQFTAINSLSLGKKTIHTAYKVNNDIAVYLKYASKPTGTFSEYVFTFTNEHLSEIKSIARISPKTFVVLVCVKDREICCLSHAQLFELVHRREKALGRPEDSLAVIVTAPTNKSLRTYVNAPGKKRSILGKEIIISRNAFPDVVFAQ